MRSDVLMFLRAWVAEPFRVGAIAPSGAALAEIITREISPATGHVIELGPGTGVFTAKLLDRGVRPEDLTLIEFGDEFTSRLETRFPTVRILHMDAGRDEVPTAGAVISGLPLLSMSPRKVMAILGVAFGRLRPDGVFYQFTYSGRCPVARPILDRLDLEATMVGRTLCNAPPASVYRLSRRQRREPSISAA